MIFFVQTYKVLLVVYNAVKMLKCSDSIKLNLFYLLFSILMVSCLKDLGLNKPLTFRVF